MLAFHDVRPTAQKEFEKECAKWHSFEINDWLVITVKANCRSLTRHES